LSQTETRAKEKAKAARSDRKLPHRNLQHRGSLLPTKKTQKTPAPRGAPKTLRQKSKEGDLGKKRRKKRKFNLFLTHQEKRKSEKKYHQTI
jgi:hypothetical protein